MAIFKYDIVASIVESTKFIDSSIIKHIDSTQSLAMCNEKSWHDSVHYDGKLFRDVEGVSPVVGEHFEVFWPLFNQFYLGIVQFMDDKKHCIAYDDSD